MNVELITFIHDDFWELSSRFIKKTATAGVKKLLWQK
jgi:hypothetical protein